LRDASAHPPGQPCGPRRARGRCGVSASAFISRVFNELAVSHGIAAGPGGTVLLVLDQLERSVLSLTPYLGVHPRAGSVFDALGTGDAGVELFHAHSDHRLAALHSGRQDVHNSTSRWFDRVMALPRGALQLVWAKCSARLRAAGATSLQQASADAEVSGGSSNWIPDCVECFHVDCGGNDDSDRAVDCGAGATARRDRSRGHGDC
jgi:hypothetical protein